ncbi:hypothetical protein [Micromonospora sediminicola]|uniref:hypothetical protein n=1 Tax=Micromonospora sediminicola TaxID=946078 RepID=UPI0037B47995
MPDPIFSGLYQDTEHLIWTPTDQVRRRGRQRARRTRIAAGLAAAVAVGVVATGVVALAGPPEKTAPPVPPATVEPTTPTPTPSPSRSAEPTPSGSPSRTTPSAPAATSGTPSARPPSRAVPAAAMLQLADLPTGFTRTTTVDGDWSLESVTIYCGNESPSLQVGQVASRSVQFDSPSDWIVQRVTRHSGTSAATVMQRVRQLVTGCAPARSGDSLTILAESLGGDDALLVGSEIEGTPSRWLVVRRGDLVAQLRVDHQTTPAEARRTASSVADRLCAGTDAC